MNKGIVMEMSDRHIIVMTPEGDFRKLPQDGRTCEVGEEILFAAPIHARKVPPMAKLSGLVAAVVMCIALVTAMTNISGKADIVAYVSMDINPSVEFGIDAAEKVQDLKGLNDDGTKLISGIDFRGKELNTVAEDVLTKADAGPLASGDGDIVIASSLVKNTDKISDSAIADRLKEQVSKHIEAVYPAQAANYEVTAFAAPQEVRTAAEANGLSMGKYAIYLAAKNSGMDVPLESFKTESIRQLAKDNDGIAAIVKAQQPPAKSVFKQLLEDEKSGKLDERAKQLAEKKSTSGNDKSGKSDDKNNNGKSDSKNGNKNGKTDEKTSGKSTSKNDKKNDGLTGSILKPAIGSGKSTVEDRSSGQGKNSGQESDKNKSDSKSSSKKNDNNKNQQDDKANPPRKAEDSKAGAKPADSGNNDDTSAKNDDKKTEDKKTNGNESEKTNQDNKDSKDNKDNKDNKDSKDNGKSNNGKDNSNGKSNNSKDNNSDKYDND